MSDVFEVEGGGNQGAAAKEGSGEKKDQLVTGEGPPGHYMQYDNEIGAMMLTLPPRFSKYKAELEEDLMDAFYGSSAGGKEQRQHINEWIADWIRRKEDEDPELVAPQEEDQAF